MTTIKSHNQKINIGQTLDRVPSHSLAEGLSLAGSLCSRARLTKGAREMDEITLRFNYLMEQKNTLLAIRNDRSIDDSFKIYLDNKIAEKDEQISSIVTESEGYLI